jgi:phosphoribosylformylglycinamidine (FGAM) synthase PurS component
MLDNDEAGINGQRKTKFDLKGNKIYELKHNSKLKDAGDLVDLDITNHRLYNEIIEDYKTQIEYFI